MKSDQKNTHRHLFVPLISREQKHDDDDDQVKHKQEIQKAPRAPTTTTRRPDSSTSISMYLYIDFRSTFYSRLPYVGYTLHAHKTQTQSKRKQHKHFWPSILAPLSEE